MTRLPLIEPPVTEPLEHRLGKITAPRRILSQRKTQDLTGAAQPSRPRSTHRAC
jgi:hypothetical protein